MPFDGASYSGLREQIRQGRYRKPQPPSGKYTQTQPTIASVYLEHGLSVYNFNLDSALL